MPLTTLDEIIIFALSPLFGGVLSIALSVSCIARRISGSAAEVTTQISSGLNRHITIWANIVHWRRKTVFVVPDRFPSSAVVLARRFRPKTSPFAVSY